jgi:hypothetical protein
MIKPLGQTYDTWMVNPIVCTLSKASPPSYQTDWSSKPTIGVYVEFMKIVVASFFGQINLFMGEIVNVNKLFI